jgi:hypothetical protein
MKAFSATLRPSPRTRILDVGGTTFNWELLDSKLPVTLLNIDSYAPGGRGNNYTAVQGSGTRLCFPDASFDIVFSNSVIEHVGSLDEQRQFASELRRVGRQIWVQTPARSFFFEPHLLAPFIHFFPHAWQRRLVRNFTLARLRLLDYATVRELFPDCELRRERFLGFTKAFVAVRVDAGGPRL